MKKATITIIASAALAFAMPLYAADKTGMESDSEHKAGLAQPGVKSDSEQKAGLAQQGMASDPQQKAGLTQQRTDNMQSGQLITAEKLDGIEVVSQDGEELGEIRKITFDKQSREVQFVTFSRGGILGIGGEEVAVPLSAFEFGAGRARLTVDQSKLENVPQQTAEATDSDYLRDLETHYGLAPAWGRGGQGDPTQTQQMNQKPTESRKVDTQN